MTITPLHAAVIGWLRYDCACRIVMLERSPWYGSYRPDVIGVTKKWQVIEVEFKSTLADFKANGSKREIQMRKNGCSVSTPWKFYWAVPQTILESVKLLLEDGDGLLTEGVPTQWGPSVLLCRGATANKNAMPISKTAAIRLVMHQTGTLHRLAVAAAKNSSNRVDTEEPVG